MPFSVSMQKKLVNKMQKSELKSNHYIPSKMRNTCVKNVVEQNDNAFQSILKNGLVFK